MADHVSMWMTLRIVIPPTRRTCLADEEALRLEHMSIWCNQTLSRHSPKLRLNLLSPSEWKRLSHISKYQPSPLVLAAVINVPPTTLSTLEGIQLVIRPGKKQCLQLPRLRSHMVSAQHPPNTNQPSIQSSRSTPAILALPPEVQLNVLRHLSDEDLFQLALTCSNYYSLSLPALYERLTIDDARDWTHAIGKMGALLRNQILRTYLRHVEIICALNVMTRSSFMLPIIELLQSLLTSQPRLRLQSFKWDICIVSKNITRILRSLPPGIRRLNITARTFEPIGRVYALENLWPQIDCISTSLRHLSVHISPSLTTTLSPMLMAALRQSKGDSSQLSHLELQGVHLAAWCLGEIRSLEFLSLQKCKSIDRALGSWMDNHSRGSRLTQLELMLLQPSELLVPFLSHASTNQLKSLKIIAERLTLFPVYAVGRLQLNTLVLESRRTYYALTTVLMYSIEDLVWLIDTCRTLAVLSMPVELVRGIYRPLVSLHCC